MVLLLCYCYVVYVIVNGVCLSYFLHLFDSKFQNFTLLHSSRLSLWKLSGRGAALKGVVLGGGICKIPILMSVIHGQEGILHYFNAIIKMWYIEIFFSLVKVIVETGKEECYHKKVFNSVILISDTRIQFPFTHMFEGTVSSACFCLCLYFQNAVLQGLTSIRKSLKS